MSVSPCKECRVLLLAKTHNFCFINNSDLTFNFRPLSCKFGNHWPTCELSFFLLVDLLPKPVPVGQAFSGPQDIVLRCGALPVLRYDRSRQHWLSPDWIFFQGQQDLDIKELIPVRQGDWCCLMRTQSADRKMQCSGQWRQPFPLRKKKKGKSISKIV